MRAAAVLGLLWWVGLAGASSGVTVNFTDTGGYSVHLGGRLLLQSAAVPCGIHKHGVWCSCGAGLRLPLDGGRTNTHGTDALGPYSRTELRWNDQAGNPVLLTAVRVYQERHKVCDKNVVQNSCCQSYTITDVLLLFGAVLRSRGSPQRHV